MEATDTEKSLVSQTAHWIASHVWLSDVIMATLGLFVFSSLLHRLTHKGPMLWPVLGIIPDVLLHLGDVYHWATDALIRTGGQFRYRGMWFGGAHGIVTANPASIEHMLKTHFANFPKGRYYQERFRELLGDGIFNADGPQWREQRRAATSEMHSARFVDYSLRSVRELVHGKLLRLLGKLSASGSHVDMQEILLRFTFDNICTAAFGVDPGCLDPGLPEVPFAKAFEDATELTLMRFVMPPFAWKTMRFLGVGFERRLLEAVRVVHEFADNTVLSRREELVRSGNLSARSDLLSRLMENRESNFSNKFLKDFCISFILAGRDTSSVGLAWFFWLIHEHPHVQTRILREIRDILDRRGLPSAGEYDGVVFTVEELKRMVYLQASLSESLRLYPPVPLDFKEVVEEDVFPDGTAVERGARVLYSIFSMARMESIWGKDCAEFKPERWMDEEGRVVSENLFKYPVFNAGPRVCVGKKFAYMQMKMVAASVLLRYEVLVVKGCAVVPKMTTTLYMKNGLLVTVKPR